MGISLKNILFQEMFWNTFSFKKCVGMSSIKKVFQNILRFKKCCRKRNPKKSGFSSGDLKQETWTKKNVEKKIFVEKKLSKMVSFIMAVNFKTFKP